MVPSSAIVGGVAAKDDDADACTGNPPRRPPGYAMALTRPSSPATTAICPPVAAGMSAGCPTTRMARAVGGCTVPNDWHVFTLWPHMHQTAVHQKTTLNGTTLLDADYQFAEQKNYPMAETVFRTGDTVSVTCTYVNNTGTTKHFGESSTDEMCFTGMYKYPADGNVFGCVSGQPF